MIKKKENSLPDGREPRNVCNAVDLALTGYTCSESIIIAFANDLGIEPDIAAKISVGFAGGMAHGKTCGAVTGAIMAIGLKYGAGLIKNQYAKDRCFHNTQEFFCRFKARRKTVECGKILMMNNINPNNPEEIRTLRDKKLCDKIIRDAAEILEEIFDDDRL